MKKFNWMKKRILVTGAGGFIGSHLSEHLVKLGANVRAMVHYNSLGTWGWLDNSPLRNKINVFAGDIVDRDSVRKAVKDCDMIFHLAALIGIPYSYEAVSSYVQTNIMGTLNVMQAAKESKVKRIIHTSTSEAYGSAQYVPIDEKHTLQAQSPYSATKIGADKLAESFYQSFNLPVTIVRPFNTYGPRQSARAVIPTIIIQLLKGKKEIKLGSLNTRRDFTYVSDTCSGFLKIAESEKAIGEEINIARGKDVSIGELAEKISFLICKRKIKITSEKSRIRPRKSEVMKLLGSNKKIQSLTDWMPHYTLEKGLIQTIKWLKENIHLYKAEIYNV